MGSEIVRGGELAKPDILQTGKRVGDTERDAVTSGLAGAYAKGYITHEVYEARYAIAQQARSQHDLEQLTADLPVHPPSTGHIIRGWAPWAGALLASFFVAVPLPFWWMGTSGSNWCSGSGASQYCWTQHSAVALATTWSMVFLGVLGMAVTILTFCTRTTFIKEFHGR